jgi:hypothetical protein
MAQIHGQVESWKRLQRELKSRGIQRFNTINEINDFLNNFRDQNETILRNHRENLKNEIRDLNQSIKRNLEQIEITQRKTQIEIEVRIDTAKINIDNLSVKENKNFIHKILNNYRLKKQKKLLDYLSSNTTLIISKATESIKKKIGKDEKQLEYLNENSEQIIRKRSQPEIQKLENIKEILEDLNLLIAGAVGESLVVKEIEKLPDDFILINDFNLRFKKPIYKIDTREKILSVQIDHLLIAKSGIYILETKNWSKKSIESPDLRSPVEQIRRTSYALYLVLSRANIKLKKHHWGKRKIPIKSIIVMINEKPREEFKYVRVKSLRELTGYISYFEPAFTESEVEQIAKYFLRIQN